MAVLPTTPGRPSIGGQSITGGASIGGDRAITGGRITPGSGISPRRSPTHTPQAEAAKAVAAAAAKATEEAATKVAAEVATAKATTTTKVGSESATTSATAAGSKATPENPQSSALEAIVKQVPGFKNADDTYNLNSAFKQGITSEQLIQAGFDSGSVTKTLQQFSAMLNITTRVSDFQNTDGTYNLNSAFRQNVTSDQLIKAGFNSDSVSKAYGQFTAMQSVLQAAPSLQNADNTYNLNNAFKQNVTVAQLIAAGFDSESVSKAYGQFTTIRDITTKVSGFQNVDNTYNLGSAFKQGITTEQLTAAGFDSDGVNKAYQQFSAMQDIISKVPGFQSSSGYDLFAAAQKGITSDQLLKAGFGLDDVNSATIAYGRTVQGTVGPAPAPAAPVAALVEVSARLATALGNNGISVSQYQQYSPEAQTAIRDYMKQIRTASDDMARTQYQRELNDYIGTLVTPEQRAATSARQTELAQIAKSVAVPYISVPTTLKPNVVVDLPPTGTVIPGSVQALNNLKATYNFNDPVQLKLFNQIVNAFNVEQQRITQSAGAPALQVTTAIQAAQTNAYLQSVGLPPITDPTKPMSTAQITAVNAGLASGAIQPTSKSEMGAQATLMAAGLEVNSQSISDVISGKINPAPDPTVAARNLLFKIGAYDPKTGNINPTAIVMVGDQKANEAAAEVLGVTPAKLGTAFKTWADVRTAIGASGDIQAQINSGRLIKGADGSTLTSEQFSSLSSSYQKMFQSQGGAALEAAFAADWVKNVLPTLSSDIQTTYRTANSTQQYWYRNTWYPNYTSNAQAMLATTKGVVVSSGLYDPAVAIGGGVTRNQWIAAGLDAASYDKANVWYHMNGQTKFIAMTDPKSPYYNTNIPVGSRYAGQTDAGGMPMYYTAEMYNQIQEQKATSTLVISSTLSKYAINTPLTGPIPSEQTRPSTTTGYNIQRFIQDNPTQASIAVLQAAGFDSKTIADAQAFVNTVQQTVSTLSGNLTTSQRQAFMQALITAGIAPAASSSPTIGYGILGNINVGIATAVMDAKGMKSIWNNLTPEQKNSVAAAYSADLNKGNVFAESVGQLGRATSSNIVAQVVTSPFMPILNPIAKATTGQPVSGTEIATAVAVAALDALGLGTLDLLSLTPQAAKIVAGAILGTSAGVFAPGTIKTVLSPDVPIAQKGLAIAGELGLLLGVAGEAGALRGVTPGVGQTKIPVKAATIPDTMAAEVANVSRIVDSEIAKASVVDRVALSELSDKIAKTNELITSKANIATIKVAVADVASSISSLKAVLPDAAASIGTAWKGVPILSKVAEGFQVVTDESGQQAVIYKGFTLGDRPIIGISKGRIVAGVGEIKAIPKGDLDIPVVGQDVHNLTIEPRTNLDNAIMMDARWLAKTGTSNASELAAKLKSIVSEVKTFYGKTSPDLVPENMLKGIKYLSADEVRTVLLHALENKNIIDKTFGSYTMPPQFSEEVATLWSKVFERIPGDIDQITKPGITEEQVASYVKSTADDLMRTNSRISYDSSKPGQIQILDPKTGVVEKTLEVHRPDEAPSESGVQEFQEKVYGFSKSSPSVTVDVPGVGKLSIARLSETGVGKLEQVGAWRIDPETGDIVTRAAPARAKDYPDFYSILYEYKGKAVADAWLKEFPEAKAVIDEYAGDLKEVANGKQTVDDFKAKWGEPEKTVVSLSSSDDASVSSIGKYSPIVTVVSPGLLYASNSRPVGITSVGNIISVPVNYSVPISSVSEVSLYPKTASLSSLLSLVSVPSRSSSISEISKEWVSVPSLPSVSPSEPVSPSLNPSPIPSVSKASSVSVAESPSISLVSTKPSVSTISPVSKAESPSAPSSVSTASTVSAAKSVSLAESVSPSTVSPSLSPSVSPPSTVSPSTSSSVSPSPSPPSPSSYSPSPSSSSSSPSSSRSSSRALPFIAGAKQQQQEALKEAFRGGVAWKQGIVYWVGKHPFSTIQDWHAFSRKDPPPEIKIVPGGPKSAYASIQALGYEVPKDMTLKLGFQKVRLSEPSTAPGKEGAIGFENVAGKDPTVDVVLKYKYPGQFRDAATSFRQTLSRTPEVTEVSGTAVEGIAAEGMTTKGMAAVGVERMAAEAVVKEIPEVKVGFRQGVDTGYPGAFRDPSAFRTVYVPQTSPEQGTPELIESEAQKQKRKLVAETLARIKEAREERERSRWIMGESKESTSEFLWGTKPAKKAKGVRRPSELGEVQI